MDRPKYRAWHKEHKKMYRVVALHLGKVAQDVTVQEDEGSLFSVRTYPIEEIELMQACSFQDRLDKDIYKDDILLIGDHRHGQFHPWYPVCYVTWRRDRFVFASPQGGCWSFQDRYFEEGYLEVIGNRYEHPHLLEQQLHLVGIDETDTLFQCGICGEEWLFNPLMFKNDPDPEKRKIAYCPGKGVTHEVDRA